MYGNERKEEKWEMYNPRISRLVCCVQKQMFFQKLRKSTSSYLVLILISNMFPEAYSEPYQRSKMVHFVKIVNGWK